MMNHEQAREAVTHDLAGELSADDRRALEAYRQAHPDFSEEEEAMRAVWGQLGALKAATPAMEPALHRAIAPRKPLRLYWLAVAASVVVLLAALLQVPDPVAPGGVNPPDTPLPPVPVVTAAEKPYTQPGLRLMRHRGLVLRRGPRDTRWHLLPRGGLIRKDEMVRVPVHAHWGAALLAPDGSTITLNAGTDLAYQGARQYKLPSGTAHFAVAKGSEPFTVHTPRGQAIALGTEFSVAVPPKKDNTVLCEVTEGVVRFTRANAFDLKLNAGQVALSNAEGGRLVDPQAGSQDWLTALAASSAADETMARLVARSKNSSGRLPLEIHKYNVDVTVVDGVARTFLDMTFFNHTSRRLEGTFFYTLPADATVSQFQMYVGSTLIKGEVLEQQRARQIFEYIRREQRDPALLEWAGGNLFKMRVYPIEPHSEKRIQLGYTQILPRREGKVQYTFPLVSEMLTKNPLRELGLTFKCLSTPGLDELVCLSHDADPRFNPSRTRGALAFQAKNYTPNRDFSVQWQVPDEAECIVLSNGRSDETEGYFLAALDPKVPVPPRDPPKRLLLLLDGSASVDAQSFSVAREFAGATGSMSGDGWSINLALVGSGAEFFKEDFVPVEDLDLPELHRWLDKRKPLGGTDLVKAFGEVAETLLEDESTQIVFVGDGVDSLGTKKNAGLVQAIKDIFKGYKASLSCVSLGSSYDESVLAGLAREMGGTFRAVKGVQDVFVAADELLIDLTRPVLTGVEVAFSGVETAGLYPGTIGTLYKGDTAILLGRIINGQTGTLRVSGMAGGEPFERTYPIQLPAPQTENVFLPRLWAKAHMDGLRRQMGLGREERDQYLRQQIIATSIRYQIMSPYTAFLVLESEEDYKRFGIVRTTRMVDWRGELDGVTRRDPSVSTDLPKPQAAQKQDLRIQLLPEPVAGPAVGTGRPEGYCVEDISIGGNIDRLEEERSRSGLYKKATKLISDTPFPSSTLFAARESGELEGNYAVDLDQAAATPGVNRDMSDFLNEKRENKPANGQAYGDDAVDEPAPAPVLKRDMLFKERRISSLDFGRSRPNTRGYYYRQRQQELYSAYFGRRSEWSLDGGKLLVRYRGPHYARRGVQVQPEAAQSWFDLAIVQEVAGRYDDALAALQPVLKAYPRSVKLHLYHAWLLHKAGRTPQALVANARARALVDAMQAPPKDKPDMRSSLRGECVRGLSAIGGHKEASALYRSLAAAATDPITVISHSAEAWQQARMVDDKTGTEILDEALKRFPGNKDVLYRIANSIRALDPNRALALLAKAEENGKPLDQVNQLRLTIHFAAGRPQKAAEAAKADLARAATGQMVYKLLRQWQNRDQAAVQAWALHALRNATGVSLEGAIIFAQSQNLPLRWEDGEALRARADGMPNGGRFSLYYMLNQRFGSGAKWAAVLLPLLGETETVQQTDTALSALQVLSDYGFKNPVESAIQRFQSRKDLTENQLYTLTMIRYKRKQASGDLAAALALLRAALAQTETANHRCSYVQQMVQPLLALEQSQRLTELGAAEIARFAAKKETRNYAWSLYNTLVNALQNYGLYEEARQFQKAQMKKMLPDQTPVQKPYQDSLSAIETALTQKDFEAAHEALRRLAETIEGDCTRLKLTSKDLTAEEKSKADTDLQSLTALLAAVRQRRIAVAARTPALRSAFVAECRKAKEDPVLRSRTEDALSCLRMAGDLPAYRDLLAALHKAEPKDPVWSRRLVNARLMTGDTTAAADLLAALRRQEPDDLDLAYTWYTLQQATGDKDSAEAAMVHYLALMANKPQQLQQKAQAWNNQKKKDLALRAWLVLAESSPDGNKPYAMYSAANLYGQMNQREEACALYFRLLLHPGNDYKENALNQLASLAVDETCLKSVQAQTDKALEQTDAAVRPWVQLLAWRLAKRLKKEDQVTRYRASLMALDLKNNQSLRRAVMDQLVREKQYKEACAYVLEQTASSDLHSRSNELQNAAAVMRNHNAWPQAFELYEKLLEQGTLQNQYWLRGYVQALVGQKRFSDAEKVVELLPYGQNQYYHYRQAIRSLTDAYQNVGEYDKALSLAFAHWKRVQSARHGQAGHAAQCLGNIAYNGLSKKKVSDPMKAALRKWILEEGKAYLSGGSSDSFYGSYNWRVIELLGIAKEVDDLAAECAQKADTAPALSNLAQFYSHRGEKARSKELYRKLIDTPNVATNRVQQALNQLFYLEAYAHPTPEWTKAAETLERWKRLGGLNHQAYLQNKMRCLYGLGQNEEARQAVRQCLKIGSNRRSYWQGQALAQICREFKDSAMEVECYQHALHWMRRSGRRDPGHVVNFYTALATAQMDLGQKSQAIESAVRGLSLLDRNQQSGYYQNLRRALLRLMRGDDNKGLDDLVAYYESTLVKDGEMPHMRVAFGEAFMEAGQVEKALAQFSIATDLLPKDTRLRQQVLEGYQRLNRPAKEEETYLRWAKLDPQNIAIYQNLGAFYKRTGRPEDARLAYQTMVEVRPREAAPHRAYARTLADNSDLAGAVEAMKKAIRYRPTEYEYAKELAAYLKQAKRHDEIEPLWTRGEEACRHAMQVLPDDPLPWLNCARFLKAQNRQEDARTLLQTILNRHWPRFARDTKREANKILAELKSR